MVTMMVNFRKLVHWLPVLLCAALLAGCGSKPQQWSLTDVSGHVPDLDFSLTSDQGRAVTAQDYRGNVVMLYFGYTHCPDVCPTTMAHLAAVMKKLGNAADHVKILFVSVDPARDTPKLLHAYVTAFTPRAVGLTGTDSMVAAVAHRYRVAYEAEKPGADGNYDVTHSSAIYIFDPQGKARLLATSTDSVAAIAHDVHQLLDDARA